MSKYTTEVRYICENYAGYKESQDYDKVDEIIDIAKDSIFSSFPIFDESYRSVIERKILKHYYTREIGLETVGLWKLKLNTKLEEIMPYYNQLYKSELFKFNPLYDIDYTRTNNRNRSGNNDRTNNGTKDSNIARQNNRAKDEELKRENTMLNNSSLSTNSNENRNNTDRYSDTPQGGLNGMTSVDVNNMYLSNARIINESTNNNANQSSNEIGNNNEKANNTERENTNEVTILSDKNADNEQAVFNDTESYLEYVQGKNGGNSYSKLLKEYRETFLNIDMMIIDELQPLFMGIW